MFLKITEYVPPLLDTRKKPEGITDLIWQRINKWHSSNKTRGLEMELQLRLLTKWRMY